MKKRYIFSFPYIEYEDACLDLFEKMNHEGYILKRIGTFFTFEKSDKKYKYQIDYTDRDTEFNEIIKEQGYEYIGSCNTMNFYKNENLDALDLGTEPELKKSILLKRQGLGVLIFLCFASLFMAYISFSKLTDLLSSKVSFYLNFESIISRLSYSLLVPCSFIATYSTYKKVKAIKNNTYTYHKLKKHDFILYILMGILYVSIIIMGLLVSDNIYDFLHIIDIHFIVFISKFLRNNFIQPKETIGQRRRREAILFALIFIGSITISGLSITQTTTYPESFPYSETLYNMDQTPFFYRLNGDSVGEQEYYVNEDGWYVSFDTVYYECRNKEVAKTIFENLMKEEKLIDYHSNLVEHCYIKDDEYKISYAFIKDNIVVYFSEENPMLVDQRIQEYLEFYKANQHFKQRW